MSAVPPPEPTPEPEPVQTPTLTRDDTNMGMLAHLLGLLTSVVGPLVIWLLKKDDSAFIEDQAREALNFQITILLASVVSAVLTVVCVGYFMLLGVMVVDVVFAVMATVKATNGELYRYPVTLRLVK